MAIELTSEQIAEDRNELKRLKVAAKVEAVATGLYGYQRDNKESTDGKVVVLRREADNSKLLVWSDKKEWDEVWNCRTDKRGTVIDLVQDEECCRLGRARDVLRAFLRTDRPSISRKSSASTGTTDAQTKDLAPTATAAAAGGQVIAADEPDRKKIVSTLEAAKWIPAPTYLSDRGLSASLADDRFTGCYRTTKRGAVMFPHRDQGGLAGYELRGIKADGEKLKVFSKGGKRGLWLSRNVATASLVVICTQTGGPGMYLSLVKSVVARSHY